MDATLNALGGILLKALPTFFLVLLLHFFLKRTLFIPLEKVLRQRYDATEGARKLAEESLQRAAQKTAEYEEKIRAARTEIYREQEETRRQWRSDQSAAISAARAEAQTFVDQAKAEIATEVSTARGQLGAQAESLAEQIVNKVMGKAA